MCAYIKCCSLRKCISQTDAKFCEKISILHIARFTYIPQPSVEKDVLYYITMDHVDRHAAKCD